MKTIIQTTRELTDLKFTAYGVIIEKGGLPILGNVIGNIPTVAFGLSEHIQKGSSTWAATVDISIDVGIGLANLPAQAALRLSQFADWQRQHNEQYLKNFYADHQFHADIFDSSDECERYFERSFINGMAIPHRTITLLKDVLTDSPDILLELFARKGTDKNLAAPLLGMLIFLPTVINRVANLDIPEIIGSAATKLPYQTISQQLKEKLIFLQNALDVVSLPKVDSSNVPNRPVNLTPTTNFNNVETINSGLKSSFLDGLKTKNFGINYSLSDNIKTESAQNTLFFSKESEAEKPVKSLENERNDPSNSNDSKNKQGLILEKPTSSTSVVLPNKENTISHSNTPVNDKIANQGIGHITPMISLTPNSIKVGVLSTDNALNMNVYFNIEWRRFEDLLSEAGNIFIGNYCLNEETITLWGDPYTCQLSAVGGHIYQLKLISKNKMLNLRSTVYVDLNAFNVNDKENKRLIEEAFQDAMKKILKKISQFLL